MPPASFDDYALNYDESFTHTEIGKLQRKFALDHLIPLLNSSKKVLEINCGTGIDARLLAPGTKYYLATDISEKMIQWCQNTTQSQKPGQLQFEKRAIQDLSAELEQCDVLFSNFGGLNCLSPQEIQAFALRCSALMPINSDIYFVIMGRCCVWEQFYFSLKLNFTKAFRRIKRNGVETHIGPSRFKTWYYSPREIKQLFASNFALLGQGPVGLFIPPSYLSPFFNKHPGLLRFLAVFDKVFTNFSFLANFGDHYYLHLKKQK